MSDVHVQLPASASTPAGPAPVSSAPDAPDHLAGGVLRSLSRPLNPTLSWGVVRTLLVGGITFGIYPLFDWNRRFADLVRAERQQLWHLAEWLRVQSGHPDATALRDRASSLSTRGLLGSASLLWALVAAVPLAIESIAAPHPGSRLLSLTYAFDFHSTPWGAAAGGDGRWFAFWTIGLSLGYLLHWLRIQLHAGDVRRFVDRFNHLASWEGIEPVATRPVGSGFRPAWMLGALAMISVGGLWGVPMMLSGAVQRRYSCSSAAATRLAMADRVRMMMMRRRPVMRIARPVIHRRACRQELCRAQIPPGANFCPRCGTRTVAVLNDVA